ncbi:MAG: hypothetical protein GXO86_01510 [Chlorobi bacterium]|nr:hypothetical protein [Chlorobiota bacterium]
MKRIKAGFLIFLFFQVAALAGQATINSPYSRYGLGELHGKNINTKIQGMGGIAIAMWNSGMLNPANPASYGKIDSASFILDVSLFGVYMNHRTTLQSESSNLMTLNYVFFGFPVTRWWRTSLGIMPFSKIGYDVKLEIDMSQYNFNNVINEINGQGGINRFYWGNGFNIGKRLRLGIDATFLFGRAQRSSMVYFPDSIYIAGTKIENSTTAEDFIFDYGIQYDIPLSNNQMITLGAVYANKFNLRAKRSTIAYTLNGGFNGDVEFPLDTLLYEPDAEGTIILPSKFGFGLVYRKHDRWLLGADFEWQNWEKFRAFGLNDSLDNAWRVSVGGQLTPKHTSISSLLKRMTYRAGFHYDDSYVNIYGHSINQYGITIGVTFPMKRSKTTIDLAIEAGTRGTTKDNLIQENYVRFSFAVAIFENWFQKRKYQ